MLLSIQSQLTVKLIKSKKSEEFPPHLSLVGVGTRFTEAEEILKVKPPSF